MKNALLDLGKYEGVAISARDDGYVNATQMCKACGKLWGNYWQIDQTREFTEALSLNIGIPIDKLVHSEPGRYGGTWVHRQVAINLAQWLSPQFAVWCNCRLDELFQTGSTFVNREHAEHSIVIAAVSELCQQAIAPMASSIVCIQRDVGDIKDRLGRVEVAVATYRRPITGETKSRHLKFLKSVQYSGKCPCCESGLILQDCKFTGQFDHWYGRQHRELGNTWPVCVTCNLRLATDPVFKDSAEPMFLSYQKRREQWEQPLL